MIKLSRTKIELSIECPRCFWLNMRHGISRPSGPPFTLNMAIDYLFKKEFDVHREAGTAHYVIKKNNLDAIPYNCPEMNTWRHNFTGIQVEHQRSGFLVYGAVDDIWINSKQELIVVDYKATGAKEHAIYDSYKRQMTIYQWLLRQKGFSVSGRGYFLFARVNKDKGFIDAKLSFDTFLEPCDCIDDWVEVAIMNAKQLMDGDIPAARPECDYCIYQERRSSI